MDASIVIATRDRADLLARTLRSLEGLDTTVHFEVIIADHGSTDETGALLNRFGGLPLRRVDVPFRGESIAEPKNAGGHAAQGDVLVFLDAGMLCPPHFLTAHLSTNAAGTPSIVAGAVVGWESEDTSDPYWRAVDQHGLATSPPEHLADPREARWPDCVDAAWMLVWGANMSLPRSAFVEHGGFDERLAGWGWDDLELAFRLGRAGIAPAYSARSWAVHYPHPRRPLNDRMRTARANWLRAYDRHRSPDLETWESCGYWSHAACLRWLRDLTTSLVPELPDAPPRPASVSSRVLYGFAGDPGRLIGDTAIVWPGQTRRSDVDVESFGLRTWLPTGHADVAVASPALLALDHTPEPGWPSFAEGVLRELGRVARAVRVGPARRLTGAERHRLHELAVRAGLPDFDTDIDTDVAPDFDPVQA